MEAAPWMREAAKDVIDKAKGVWLCGSDCLPCVQDVAQIIAKYAPPQPTLHECQCIILAPRSSKYCADCGGLVEANQVVAPQDTSSPDKCGQRFTCAATGLRIYTCALEKGHDGDCDDHPTRGLAAKEGWQNP